MNMLSNGWIRVLGQSGATLLCLAMVPPISAAAERDVSERGVESSKSVVLRVGAQASDNIGRDQAEESGVFGLAGVAANVSGERSSLSWSLNGNLDFYDYSMKEYDNEVVGSAIARGAIWLFDDRLNWNLSNEFGQLRSDNLAAEGPSNRSRFNVIETGPTLELPLSAVTAVLLEGSFGERTFEEAGQVDSSLTSLQVGIVRALGVDRKVAVFASKRTIDFDSAKASDYEVTSGFLRLTQALRVDDTLTLDLGQNQLKPESGDENSGLFVRISASQKIGARSRLVLRAVQDYQDAGYALRDTVGAVSGGGAEQIGLTSDPMERRSFGADFNVTWARTQLGLMTEVSTETYETESQRDRDATTVSLGLSRSLSPDMSLSLRGSLRREEFSNADQTADEQQLALSLSRSLGRSLSLALSYQRWEREEDTQNGFTENQVSLTLQYSPWRGR